MCVTSLLCGPWADLWPFNGLYCKRFSLYITGERKPFTVQPIKRPKIFPWITQERRNTHFMQGKLFFIEIVNPFIFVGYENDRFFPHTNPYISKSMLRNDADVRQCSYFELGLYLCTHCMQIIFVSRYPAAENCFQKTCRYPAVRNFDQFFRNSSFNSSNPPRT